MKAIVLCIMAMFMTACSIVPLDVTTNNTPAEPIPVELTITVDMVDNRSVVTAPSNVNIMPGEPAVVHKKVICKNPQDKAIMQIRYVDKAKYRATNDIKGYTLAKAKAYDSVMAIIKEYQGSKTVCR